MPIRIGLDMAINKKEIKMFEQTGKGILEKLKGASINLEEIPAPITNEAMAIYDAFLKKIEDAGVPITEVNVWKKHFFGINYAL